MTLNGNICRKRAVTYCIAFSRETRGSEKNMCSRPYSEGKRDGRLTKESWSQWNTLGHLIVLYVRHQTLPVSHGTWPLLAVVNVRCLVRGIHKQCVEIYHDTNIFALLSNFLAGSG